MGSFECCQRILTTLSILSKDVSAMLSKDKITPEESGWQLMAPGRVRHFPLRVWPWWTPYVSVDGPTPMCTWAALVGFSKVLKSEDIRYGVRVCNTS